MGDRCYHGIKPAEECTECDDFAEALFEQGYTQGKIDGRRDALADVVAWLRDEDNDSDSDVWPVSRIVLAIERGDAPRGEEP